MLEDVLSIEETRVTVRKYRHRTTVPAKIFKLLKLKDGDVLRWIAMKDGKIFIKKIKRNKSAF
jgi:bifunctional DNA-binding transcriptional regulator/antitoxin component of YhaV-PrlF toxin-antitoxin module